MGIIVRMMIWFKHRTGYVLNPPESTASKLFILYYVSLIEVNLLKKSNNIWSWQLSYPKRQMSKTRPNPLVSNCKLLYSAHFMTHWHFETLFRSMNIGCSVTCDDNITELFWPFWVRGSDGHSMTLHREIFSGYNSGRPGKLSDIN